MASLCFRGKHFSLFGYIILSCLKNRDTSHFFSVWKKKMKKWDVSLFLIIQI